MAPDAPRFSIVCPVYNVENVLDEFLDSIEDQSQSDGYIELIAVDAGSTDASIEILKRRSLSSSIPISVIEEGFTEAASARNRGMDLARGEWITFSDPSDLLHAGYFENADSFLNKHPEVDLAATRVVIRDGIKQRDVRNNRSYMFSDQDKVVDLEDSPEYFPYSATSALFRREALERLGLRFDPKLKPYFDDVRLTAEFVLDSGNSTVGFIRKSRYTQCQPLGAAAVRQGYLSNPNYFNVVPDNGFVMLLKYAQAKRGQSPHWLNSLILAELDWYFRSEELLNQDTAARGEVAVQFLNLVREISTYLDEGQLQSFQPHRSRGPWPEFLLCDFGDKDWHLPYVIRSPDEDGQTKITYNFSGTLPHEELTVDGEPATIIANKIRSYRYFEQDIHFERIIWVESGSTLRVKINGQDVSVLDAYRGPLGDCQPKTEEATLRTPYPRKWSEKFSYFREHWRYVVAKWKIWDHRYENSWILADRLHNASDSGETTFKYLQKQRPDIKSYFLIDKETDDYIRLKNEGYGNKLLTPGTLRWFVAIRRASYLISTHSPRPLVSPPEYLQYADPRWKLVFLQHGVTTRDMSRWLNQRDFSLFITATPDEHDSIIDDYTPYEFTTHEVKLTGFPRFDEHLRVNAEVPENEKNLVVIAPTWRYWLTLPIDESGKASRQVIDDVLESEFIQEWMKIVKSEELAKVAESKGLQLAFLLHPNLREAESQLELPEHIKRLSFLHQSPQEIFARTNILVTDYSSIAFDVAYLDRPTVYFQFDSDRIDAGVHNGRPGYFDYTTMGFGPLTADAEQAISAIAEGMANQSDFGHQYRERIERTFPNRDGNCTERVVAEIEQLKNTRS